jgi:hypothetical protein
MINVYAGSKPHSICVIYILPKIIEKSYGGEKPPENDFLNLEP